MSVNPSKSFYEYLYHLTTKEALPKILKEGLVPNIGESSKMAEESRSAVFLCDDKSLPYWRILLNKDTLLKVKVSHKDDLEFFDYDLYGEYLYKDNISPDNIEVIDMLEPTLEQYKEILKSYICSISYACYCCAEYYTYGKDKVNITIDIIRKSIISIKIVSDRLNYSYMSTEELRVELKGLGQDGYYTFLDKYYNTDKSLWQKLIDYPSDETMELRRWLYNFVKRQFSNVLDVDTGGWGV